MTEKTASKTVNKLVDEISKLSVLELSELVNELQDVLGISAMPMAAAAPAASSNDESASDDADATKTVMMTAIGDNKISIIKALREINQSWGLKEAKDMTENLPAEIMKDAKPEDVKKAVDVIKTAGGTTELK